MTTFTRKDIHVTFVQGNQVNFDKSTIEEEIAKNNTWRSVYLGKEVKMFKNGEETTEKVKAGDVCNIKFEINKGTGKNFINIIGINIIGFQPIEKKKKEVNFEDLF